jgi:hypothetical protein
MVGSGGKYYISKRTKDIIFGVLLIIENIFISQNGRFKSP